MEKIQIQDPESGMNTPDLIFENLSYSDSLIQIRDLVNHGYRYRIWDGKIGSGY
jgi:hypothetical protein